MLSFITTYWLEALFGVILAGLSFLVKRLFFHAKTARTVTTAVQTGITCMLRDRMIHNHEKYMRQRCCPLAVRESMEDMYCAYKALGGNGAIDHIVAELNDLPTILKGENQ